MSAEILLVIVAAGLGLLYQWGFRVLPRDHWQILFVVPTAEGQEGPDRQGINFTWYGFWSATGAVAACLWLIVLLGSVGASLLAIAALVTGIFLLCLPSARWIARVVERKPHTQTVAGATFMGFLGAPLIISLLNVLGKTEAGPLLPFFPSLAGLGIALGLGEGIGRLACLSFGCCYGRPVSSLPERWRGLFGSLAVRFQGPLKKAVYAGQAADIPLVPIQAMTSTVVTTTSLIGSWLFLSGHFKAALLLTLAGTQGWRFVSEYGRRDERGPGESVTTYQLMAVMLLAGVLLLLILPVELAMPVVDLSRGLRSVWRIEVFLLLQLLWLALFAHLGRSQVTGAKLWLFLHRDRV